MPTESTSAGKVDCARRSARRSVSACDNRAMHARAVASGSPVAAGGVVLGARVPIVVVEDVLGQLRRRRNESIGADHRLDVVEDQPDMPRRVHRVKPDGPAVEHQTGDVRQRAGAKAPGLGQVDDVPQLAPQPLLLERLRRNRRIATLSPAATATGKAVRQVRPALNDVDRPTVGPNHTLSMHRAHRLGPSLMTLTAAAAPRPGRGRREWPSQPQPAPLTGRRRPDQSRHNWPAGRLRRGTRTA